MDTCTGAGSRCGRHRRRAEPERFRGRDGCDGFGGHPPDRSRGEGGFKCRDRLALGGNTDREIAFTRHDAGSGAVVSLNAAAVLLHTNARPLFQRVLGGEASPMGAQEFRCLWQERVRQLLIDHAHDAEVIVLRSTR
jgi:hypothetical protein